MTQEIQIETERKCTDVPAFVICATFLVITVLLVSYCAIFHSSISSNYDDCGNFCGKNNDDNPFDCGEKDLRGRPKLLDTHTGFSRRRQCVAECPSGYIDRNNQCQFPNTFVSSDLNENEIGDAATKSITNNWHSIAIMCLVAFVFSYVFLILFRHAAKYVIWIINIGCTLLVVALTIFCLLHKVMEGALIFGIISILMIVLLIWFHKRINLVAKLFKESSKALIDVPVVMFEPILTFIALIISFIIFIYFAFIIETSVELIRIQNSDETIIVRAREPMVATVTRYVNMIAFVWFLQFIFGCQHFVIAGTICKWYFSRDKTKLNGPISTSFSNLVRFHIGSICFGATIITIIKIIKALLSGARNEARNSRNIILLCIVGCLKCILDLIDEFLQYLFRNAYIIIAKEGTPFVTSGKRAYRLLLRNIVDVVALNQFGDIVLVVCRILIMLIAGFVGYELMDKKDHFAIPLMIGIIFTFLIAHCFVMVFEMTIDTIFLCFCIDCEENDGTSRPYYMSDGLKKIMLEMKEEAGGTLILGSKNDVEFGMADGSNIPMLPQQSYGKEAQSPYLPTNYTDPPPYPGPQPYQQQPYPEQSYMQQQQYYQPQVYSEIGEPQYGQYPQPPYPAPMYPQIPYPQQ